MLSKFFRNSFGILPFSQTLHCAPAIADTDQLRHATHCITSACRLGQAELELSVSIGGFPLKRTRLISESGTAVAAITTVDYLACNGVVHKIDAVMLPSAVEPKGTLSSESTPMPTAMPTGAPSFCPDNVLERINENQQLSLLATAIRSAGLQVRPTNTQHDNINNIHMKSCLTKLVVNG